MTARSFPAPAPAPADVVRALVRTVAVGLALGLSACLSTPHQQSMPQASDFIESPSVHNHAVRFSPYDVVLTEAERVRLAGFVLSVRPDEADRVTVSGGGLLAQERVATVAGALGEAGVFVAERRPQPGDHPTVVVAVHRETLIPVRCQPGPVPLFDTLRPIAPPGCANDLALARMIADPADLTHGRSMGAADGPGSVLAIDRYRTDTGGILAERRALIVYGATEGAGD